MQGINTGRFWKHDRKYPIQDFLGYIERQGKQRHDNELWKCVDCGRPVWKKATRCRVCENKHRVTIKPVDRNGLKELIRNVSFAEIGRMYKVTINTIKKWCKRYNLPFKKEEINAISSEDWLLI